MRIILLIIFFILSFSITTYSWEKVPVPTYVDKKVKSPWNFFEDFENLEEGKLKFNQIFRIYDKGAGLKPIRIKNVISSDKKILPQIIPNTGIKYVTLEVLIAPIFLISLT